MTAPVPDFDAAQLRQLRDAPDNLARTDSFHARSFARSMVGAPKLMPRCSDSFAAVIWCVAWKKGLRRNAAAIEANAAETFVLLDEDDFLAQVSGVERGRVSPVRRRQRRFRFWLGPCSLSVPPLVVLVLDILLL